MEFVNPGFLYGLFATIIPIIIHLFNFRRFKKIYFSNVSFIKELKEQTQKQSKLKHLIILFTRILAIIFIVLAFARPYIPVTENLIKPHVKNAVSLYIDNSFSLQAESEKGILLDEAKSKALEVISVYKSSDLFQLLTNDFEGRHQRFVSKDEFTELLDEVNISPVVRSVSEVIIRQSELFDSRPSEIKTSFIISDMQKGIFSDNFRNTETKVNTYLIPVAAINSDNLFIDTCWFETPVRHVNQNIVLKALIKNSSAKDYEKISITLKINGNQKALSSFDIEPYSDTQVSLHFTNYETGSQHGILEINDYPITFDDHLFFSYSVSPVTRVLCINNENDNLYLNSLFRNDSVVEFRNIDAGNLDYSKFGENQLIIVNELEDFSSGLRQALISYVSGGGSLVIIPGRDIRLESYNELSLAFNTGNFISLDTNKNRVSYINLEHPLYRDVFDEIPENIDLPDVFRYYKIKTGFRTRQEKILGLQTGDVFLSAAPFEKGKVYHLSVPLRTNYSNFPQHAILVPTIHKIAILSASDHMLYYTIGKDEVIGITNVNLRGDDVLKIKSDTDEFEFIPEHRKVNSGLELFTHGQITKSGNYNIYYGNDQISELSFNYDRTESEMIFLTEDEINEFLITNKTSAVSLFRNTDKPFVQTLTEMSRGVGLWKWCVLLTLFFLLMEVLLLRFWK